MSKNKIATLGCSRMFVRKLRQIEGRIDDPLQHALNFRRDIMQIALAQEIAHLYFEHVHLAAKIAAEAHDKNKIIQHFFNRLAVAIQRIDVDIHIYNSNCAQSSIAGKKGSHELLMEPDFP